LANRANKKKKLLLGILAKRVRPPMGKGPAIKKRKTGVEKKKAGE